MRSGSGSINSKIIGTLGTSVVLVLVQLVILLSRSREFDSVQQGYASLFLINIDLIAHLSMIVGGSALVYLSTRHKLRSLILPTYIWAVFSSVLGFGILYLSGQIREEYSYLVYFASLLQGLLTAHIQIHLGKNDVKWFNAIQIIQYIILAVVLLILIHQNGAHYLDFVLAYLIALGISFIISSFRMMSYKDPAVEEESVLKSLFNLGLISIIGALAQRINSRFTVYVLNASFIWGTALVGLFTTGQMIIEKVMIISRSFASVQYGAISSGRNKENSVRLTNRFLKISTYLTLLALIIAVILPENWYLEIIGRQWKGIKEIILWLSPAILILSVSNIFSHYFSGLGRFKINAFASLAGLAITISIAFILIPAYGILGCIWTILVSYSSMTLFQAIVYIKENGFKVQSLLITGKDIEAVKKLFSRKGGDGGL